MEPFEHQKEGGKWLVRQAAHKQNQLLADDPGLGKTRTAIMALMASGATNIVVVCPAVARPVWVQQWRRWALGHWDVHICHTSPALFSAANAPLRNKARGKIIITGFDMWSTKSSVGQHGESEARMSLLQAGHRPDYMVIDEGHYLKELDSNRTKEVFSYAEYTGLIAKGRVLVLTGTPAPNHYGEIFPILRHLWGQDMVARGFNSRQQFENHFCVTREVFIKDRPSVTVITGSKNPRDLKNILKDKMLRRKKTEVFKDMPPLIFDTLPLDVLANTQDITIPDMDIYDDDELLVVAKQAPATQRRLVGLSKVGPSVQYIQEQLENNPTHKMVIFAVHHDVIDELAKALVNNYRGVVVDGRVSDTKRTEAVEKFQNDPRSRIFIGQIQAAGTAITLTAASEVLFVESDYVPMNNYQAACRCHRIGTKAPVIARHAVIPHTVDKRIMEILARKEAELAQVF